MRFLKVLYDGRGYGRALTEAAPTAGSSIRLEDADAWQLAQLYCDVAGEEQDRLHYDKRMLARWVMSYGIRQFGERPFCALAAACWVWQRPAEKAPEVTVHKNKTFTVEVSEDLNYESQVGLQLAVRKIPYQERAGALGFRLVEATAVRDGRRELRIQATFR